jgi:hypothetical protein
MGIGPFEDGGGYLVLVPNRTVRPPSSLCLEAYRATGPAALHSVGRWEAWRRSSGGGEIVEAIRMTARGGTA